MSARQHSTWKVALICNDERFAIDHKGLPCVRERLLYQISVAELAVRL